MKAWKTDRFCQCIQHHWTRFGQQDWTGSFWKRLCFWTPDAYKSWLQRIVKAIVVWWSKLMSIERLFCRWMISNLSSWPNSLGSCPLSGFCCAELLIWTKRLWHLPSGPNSVCGCLRQEDKFGAEEAKQRLEQGRTFQLCSGPVDLFCDTSGSVVHFITFL